jgi:hypothetical protein
MGFFLRAPLKLEAMEKARRLMRRNYFSNGMSLTSFGFGTDFRNA